MAATAAKIEIISLRVEILLNIGQPPVGVAPFLSQG
jgi:hypothetical protein